MVDHQTTDRDGSDRTTRRHLLQAAGGTGAAMLSAGCKSRQREEENALENDDPNREAGERETTPTDVPDDALKGETIKVGVLAPLPDSHIVGRSISTSAEIAADELNANGGILGADVEVISGNTEASPSTAQEVYRELTGKEDVDLTTGMFSGQALLQILPSMGATKTMHITTGAASLQVAEEVRENYEKYKYHFRAGPLNTRDLAFAQLEFLNLYADRFGWDSATLVVENIVDLDPYYETLKENLDDFLDLRFATRSSGSTTNWSPIYDKIEAQDADVMLCGLAITGTAAVKQWANQKRPFEFGGIHLFSQLTNYYEQTGGACEYVFCMNSVTPQTSNTKLTKPFMKEFFEREEEYPIYSGAITYDAVRMYADAIEQTGSLDPEDLIPYLEERVWKESSITDTHEFAGKDAEFPHDPAWTSMKESGVPLWQQWQTNENGDPVMESFAPEQNRTAAYEKPPWI